MLFIKRLSDEFDLKRKQLVEKDFAHSRNQPELIKELLNEKTSYGETFFVPVRARWNESWVDENDALAGVLKNNIDFNAVKGKTKIPDQKWKDLLDHFNQPQFVLVNQNF